MSAQALAPRATDSGLPVQSGPAVDGGEAVEVDEITTVLMLLEAGIPLTLLLDLATPIRSVDTYRTEPGAADWLLATGVA
jgi:hypothetical protein